MLLVSEEFRQRLFVDIPFLQKTLDESKKALIPLKEERKKLEELIYIKERELNITKSYVTELRRGNVVLKRGQTLFIGEVNSDPNVKIDLGKIYNSADKYVQKIVIPSKKEIKNILVFRPTDKSEIDEVTSKGGLIILIEVATNVLKGDNLFMYIQSYCVIKLLEKGEVITTEILEKKILTIKIQLKIKTLLNKTRDKIKLRGSIANEINTRGFYKKL